MTARKSSDSRTLTSADSSAAQVRTMIEETRLVEARVALAEALALHPEDPELLNLQEVISPPRGRSCGVVDVDRSREFEWIAANRDRYLGRWVALDGSRLLADAVSFAELQSRIRNLDKVSLVHRIE